MLLLLLYYTLSGVLAQPFPHSLVQEADCPQSGSDSTSGLPHRPAFYSAKVTSSSLPWCLHLLFSLTGIPSPQISTWLSSLFHSHLCSNVTLTERACPSSLPGNLPPAQRTTSGFPSPSPAHSELSLSRAGSVSSRRQ